MASGATLTDLALHQLLQEAVETQAPASLRPEGSPRLLGDLHLVAFEPGETLELEGIRPRDQVPSAGGQATLSILVGSELLSLEGELLSIAHREGGAARLRLGWPAEARLHRRADVRVAAPEQAPLRAQVRLGGQTRSALLVNLTETGTGLAFPEVFLVDLHAPIEIDATLPGDIPLHCKGEVRHLTVLDGQEYPTRLGVVLQPEAGTDLAPMRRFIQARRTDRSQSFRA